MVSILDCTQRNLLIPVNCVGVMGKGLALQTAQRYPQVLAPYRQMCRDGILVPGRPQVISVSETQNLVMFPTKEHWRNASRIEWICEGFQCLYIQGSVAIPRLGCGLGGLSWEGQVLPVVRHWIQSHPEIEAYLCEP